MKFSLDGILLLAHTIKIQIIMLLQIGALRLMCADKNQEI